MRLISGGLLGSELGMAQNLGNEKLHRRDAHHRMNDVLQNEANSSGVFAAHQPNSPCPKTSRAVHLHKHGGDGFTRRGAMTGRSDLRRSCTMQAINAGSAIIDGEILI